jgi:hypothetical protein
MTTRTTTAAPILAVLVTLRAYFVGYFQLSTQTAVFASRDTWIRRSFSHRSLAPLYSPARLESWLSGYDVQADTWDDPKPELR